MHLSQRVTSTFRAGVFLAAVIALPATAASAAKTPRLFFGECLFGVAPEQPQGEGAVAAIGASLIKVGLGRIGKALRAAGEADTTNVAAQLNLEIPVGNQQMCAQFVVGRFDSSSSVSVVDESLDKKLGVSKLANYTKELEAAGIDLAGRPDVFLELQLRYSKDNSAVAMAPTFLSYSQSLKGGKYSSRTSRGLAVQLRFHPPGVAATDQGSTGAVVVLGDRVLGAEVEYDKPKKLEDGFEIESAWFPSTNSPPATAAERGKEDAAKKGDPAGSNPVVKPVAAKTKPMTLTVSVSEARSARPFLLFLADVFDESKEELQASLEKQLLATKRSEAELEAYKKAQIAASEYDQKFVAAEVAIAEYCSADYVSLIASKAEVLAVKNSGAARVAQSAANVAAKVLEINEPYATSIEISKTIPSSGVNGC
jgi:hypothetical protein